MPQTDLEALRQRWQTETKGSRTTSSDRLRAALDAGASTTGTPDSRLRRGLAFDIGVKVGLLAGLIAVYIAVYPVQVGRSESIEALLSIGAVLVLTIIGQLRAIVRVPRFEPHRQSALETHRTLLAYYNGPGALMVGLQSLTAPLFFLVGSTAYLILKYGTIPERAIDDWVVLGAGTLLALLIHLIPLWVVHQRQRRHIQANLDELEDGDLDRRRVERYRRGTIHLLRTLSLLALLGIVLLLILLLGA